MVEEGLPCAAEATEVLLRLLCAPSVPRALDLLLHHLG